MNQVSTSAPSLAVVGSFSGALAGNGIGNDAELTLVVVVDAACEQPQRSSGARFGERDRARGDVEPGDVAVAGEHGLVRRRVQVRAASVFDHEPRAAAFEHRSRGGQDRATPVEVGRDRLCVSGREIEEQKLRVSHWVLRDRTGRRIRACPRARAPVETKPWVPSVRRVGVLPSSETSQRSTTRSTSAVSWGPCANDDRRAVIRPREHGRNIVVPREQHTVLVHPIGLDDEQGTGPVDDPPDVVVPPPQMSDAPRRTIGIAGSARTAPRRGAEPTNAIDAPSGDHSSASISSGSDASIRGSPPSPPIGSTNSCEPLSSRWVVKASERPSGDHRALPIARRAGRERPSR